MSLTRTRTNSEVKWLANELAAATGELQRVEAEMARLSLRRDHLLEVIGSLTRVVDHVVSPGFVASIPVVQPYNRYGKRGVFRNWIRSTLREAYPQAFDTNTLTTLAATTFGVTLTCAKERRRFQDNIVRRALRHLQHAGDLECLHDALLARTTVGIWRWKANSSSFEVLRRASTSSGQQGG